MEKYGFVYIWRDKKHGRYYIGSHWGNEKDGYICSSTWMNQAYKKRPEDFKRKILEKTNERKSLNEIEHKWLQYINEEELGKRYYNLKNFKFGHWSHMDNNLSVREKISKAQKGRKLSEEWKSNIGDSLRGKPGRKWTEEQKKAKSEQLSGRTLTKKHVENIQKSRAGYKHSEETKEKIGRKHKGKTISEEHKKILRDKNVGKKLSEETKKKISANSKRIPGMKGKTHSEETKEKMSKKAKRKIKCEFCDYENNAGNLAIHMKKQHMNSLEK